jgi:NAD(P)-dependent dehydrogenase (short-subunit alcohol dehydrogenase family)
VEPPRPDEVSDAPGSASTPSSANVPSARRVAAVAGAGGAPGGAIVDALQARGWAVAAFDLPSATLPASAAHGAALDLGDRAAVQQAVDALAGELGEVECLIAVAGFAAPTPVAEISATAWRAALRAQLLSAANFAWAVLPGMLRRSAGNIVTVGSDVALGAPGGDAMQAAAGGSVIGFAKALAIELAKTGVQVNAISAQLPGGPGDGAGSSASEAAADAPAPLGRPVRVEEIAATAAYLADERHFFLGQILSPNGGRVI